MTPLAQAHVGEMEQKGRPGALPCASAAEIRSDAGGGLPPRLPSRHTRSLYQLSSSLTPTAGCGRVTGRCRSSDPQASCLTTDLPLGTAKHVPQAVPLPSLTLQGGELPGSQKGISSKQGYGHSASASATAHAGPTGLASS